MKSTICISLAILCILAGLRLAGCAERSQHGESVIEANTTPASALAPSEPPADAEQNLSNAGSYLVSYVTEPAPIPMNEMFAIRFWVRPMVAEGMVVDELDVAVDARMPHHHHGMYRVPKVEALEDGHFRATGMLFHMPGYWEIYFDITHRGVTERCQFSVEID